MTTDTNTHDDGSDAPGVPADRSDVPSLPDDGTDPPPMERATRVARLAKFVAVTLAALATVAKALGLL